jgi:multimeric flavodoxin WrbA
MLVLGIAGSPRKGGNTEMMLERALTGAAEAGAATKVLRLREYKITHCLHCGGCNETGTCIIKDDMHLIYPELRRAERLILASPVYFMGPPALTKAMIDRCQALWALKHLLKQPVYLGAAVPGKALYLSVGGTNVKELFQPSLRIIKSWLLTLEIKLAGEVTFASIDEADAVKQHATALQESYEAGRKLVTE